MNNDRRRGKDEMNLAVLPIARLGRSDRRKRIEYYGTFAENGEQKAMVWIVEGIDGLPGPFADELMLALLYIGAEQNFADKKMYFTVYRVLKTLGLTISNRNYRLVERALKQLAGVLITSDKAWIERKADGKQKRVASSRGFHVIDEYFLHYQEDDEDEGEQSYILWGNRLWKSIKVGHLKMFDIDFYRELDGPLAKRLYRFLDKTMALSNRPYQIDIFDLANKLGMAPYQYAAHLRRPLKAAAQELVDRGFLTDFEFVKVGSFSRICFHKSEYAQPFQLPLLDELIANEVATNGTITVPPSDTERATNVSITKTPEDELWQNALNNLALSGDKNAADQLRHARLLSIEDGIAVIIAGPRAEWLQDRCERMVKAELNFIANVSITKVQFVENEH